METINAVLMENVGAGKWEVRKKMNFPVYAWREDWFGWLNTGMKANWKIVREQDIKGD